MKNAIFNELILFEKCGFLSAARLIVYYEAYVNTYREVSNWLNLTRWQKFVALLTGALKWEGMQSNH